MTDPRAGGQLGPHQRRLLVHCSHPSLLEGREGQTAEDVAALQPKEALVMVREAEVHGTHVAMAELLRRAGLLAQLPARAAERLEAGAQAEAMRRLGIDGHCAGVFRALTDAGIPFVLVKGAATARLWDGITRPMTDVDVMFPPEAYARGTAALRELGYADREWDGAAYAERALGEHVFRLPDRRQVELDVTSRFVKHREMQAAYRLDDPWMWEDTQPVESAGVPVRTLGLHQELLFLLYHHVALNYLQKLLYVAELLVWLHRHGEQLDRTVLAERLRWSGLGPSFAVVAWLHDARWGTDYSAVLPPATRLPSRRTPALSELFDPAALGFTDRPVLFAARQRVRWELIARGWPRVAFALARAVPPFAHLQWLAAANSETPRGRVGSYVSYYGRQARQIVRAVTRRVRA